MDRATVREQMQIDNLHDPTRSLRRCEKMCFGEARTHVGNADVRLAAKPVATGAIALMGRRIRQERRGRVALWAGDHMGSAFSAPVQ